MNNAYLTYDRADICVSWQWRKGDFSNFFALRVGHPGKASDRHIFRLKDAAKLNCTCCRRPLIDVDRLLGCVAMSFRR